MRDVIINVLRTIDRPSFAELVRAVPAVTGGVRCICTRDDPNLIAWTNLSDDGAKTLTALIHEDIIGLCPTPALVYLVDGMVPGLPMAQKAPKDGYKTPHWIPCVLIQGPNFPKS